MSKHNEILRSNSKIGSTSFEEMFKNINPIEGGLKLKKLKIIKNTLAVSVDKAFMQNSAKKKPIMIYQTINNNNINVRDTSLNALNPKNFTPTYRGKLSKSELPSMNSNTKTGSRLTFDGVFNKQDVKKINMNPYNIPPIIIGTYQNQPQISININNYNINNYNSGNKLKNSINLSNNNINKKKNEPIKITKVVEQRTESRMNKIKLSKGEMFMDDDSISIPHSNSNIIKMNKKIGTILDGNNDSFINELTDLLSNVECNDKRLEEINKEIPDPSINIQHLQMVNSKRPQTSYGGLQARQKNLRNSLKGKKEE